MSTNIFSVYIMYKFCSLFIFFQIWGGGMAWSLWSPWHSCWPRPWNLNCRIEWHIRIQGRNVRRVSNMEGGDDPTGPSVSPGPPAGHGPETSTPEWNDTSETKGEKDRRTCIHKPVSFTFFVARASTVSKISSYVSLLQRVGKNCWRR